MQLCLLFAFTALLACEGSVLRARDAQESADSTAGLSRQKRGWNFQQFLVHEGETVNQRRLITDLKNMYKKEGQEKVHFEVKGNSMGTIFQLEDSKLYVLQQLDRETRESYSLTLYVYNAQNVLVEDGEQITITVKDENDNAPVFPEEEHKARIPENAAIGSEVIYMKATDKDADDEASDYGRVKYSIRGGGMGKFTIDSATGLVTLHGNLDREDEDLYEVVIQATDSPYYLQDVHTATTTLSVTVTDVNDNAPYFETTYVEATVKENTEYGTSVTELVAVDKDVERNAQMTYSLVDDSEFFMVNDVRNKGVLRIKKPLDFEASSDHVYDVRVRVDNTEPLVNGAKRSPTNDVVTIKVKVENVNEPPQISKLNLKFHVKENVKEGHIVGRMRAVDPENDHFSWKIEDSNDNSSSKFRINSRGELSVAGDLDREDVSSYEVVVMAGVFDEPAPLFSKVSVNIVVEDVNDNAPVPLPESRILILCQNHEGGLYEHQRLKPDLKAVDADSKSVNGIFTFTQADDPTWDHNFKLYQKEEGSAAIYTERSDFDASNTEEYKLRYIISDGGSPAMNATYTTTVKVCQCMADNTSVCGAQAIRSLVGIGTPVILIICIVAFLLIIVIVAVGLVHRRRRIELEDRLIRESTKSDDHDFNTGIGDRCEGGGEEDNLEWSLPHLMDGIRENKIAESCIVPMRAEKQMALPVADHLDYIEECKSKMDQDSDGIPFDSIQVYGYEGEGSVAGSLSSIASGSVDSEQDYDYLKEWGPKFDKLANLYGGHGSDEPEQLRN